MGSRRIIGLREKVWTPAIVLAALPYITHTDNQLLFPLFEVTWFTWACVCRMHKKLSYCWETVRRESMPRIAKMDVENDNLGWNDLQMYFKVIKSGTNRKLVCDFLLVVYSNFCHITHRFWEIWCEAVQRPWNMPKVIDSRIAWKLSCGHVCKMFGRQWTNEAKIAISNDPTFIWRHAPFQRTPANICINLILPETTFHGLHFRRWQYMGIALQIFEQFCRKAGDANPLVAEPETDFNAK